MAIPWKPSLAVIGVAVALSVAVAAGVMETARRQSLDALPELSDAANRSLAQFPGKVTVGKVDVFVLQGEFVLGVAAAGEGEPTILLGEEEGRFEVGENATGLVLEWEWEGLAPDGLDLDLRHPDGTRTSAEGSIRQPQKVLIEAPPPGDYQAVARPGSTAANITYIIYASIISGQPVPPGYTVYGTFAPSGENGIPSTPAWRRGEPWPATQP